MAILGQGNFIRYVRTIVSAVFAVVYLLAVGFIDLRAEAMTRGGVLGLNNDLVSVAPPASPWLLNVTMACLSGLLVFWLLRRPGNLKQASVYPAGAALLALTTCAVSFSATKDYSASVHSLYQPKESPASAFFCGRKPAHSVLRYMRSWSFLLLWLLWH